MTKLEKEPDFIEKLKTELGALKHGDYFLGVLEKTGVPVNELPADIAKEYPTNPAMLWLKGSPKIYLRDFTTPDDLAHECRHVEQYIRFPKALSEAPDIKHGYIFFAFAEADAIAHQLFILLQRMINNPGMLKEESEICLIYNDEEKREDLNLEPLRVFLYIYADLDPQALVDTLETNPEIQKKLMDHCFRWSLEKLIPHQYEERHLDGIWTTVQKNKTTGKLLQRTEPFEQITQADIDFFLDCIYEFGAPFDDLEACYLKDEQGFGLSPHHFLKQLFTPNVLQALTDMNQDITPRATTPTHNPEPQ